MDSGLQLALWVAIVSYGLMAGIYFTFSVFVMRSLKSLPDDMAVACMNSINTVILKSAFMPLFFGSSVLAFLLIVAGFQSLMPAWAIASGLIYLLGMLGITVMFNVPLNKQLQSVTTENQSLIWNHYALYWTRWNHVRTLYIGLCSLFGSAITYLCCWIDCWIAGG